jgi:serine/threonine protein kinase
MLWRLFKFAGHYQLWLGGIRHKDISASNLMYDKDTKDGVLIDFDLASMNKTGEPTGMDNTGTMPFMALDLLTKRGMEGQVKRLYRHDSESFAWVLLWICGRFEHGNEIENPPFQEWLNCGYNECRRASMDFVGNRSEYEVTSFYAKFVDAARNLAGMFIMSRIERDTAIMRKLPLPEPSDDKTVEEVRNVIKECGLPVFI